jgi:hypothetical protein
MKTTDHAINYIFQVLDDATGISCPIYKYNKPSKSNDSEFIVINSLPINAGVLQKCHVNVNYHVNDKQPGIPDTTKLSAMTADIMVLLEEISETGIHIDFERQEYIREENKHYSNTRFSVKLVN